MTMGTHGAGKEQASGLSGRASRRQLFEKFPGMAVAGATVASLASSTPAAAASDALTSDGRWWVFPLAPYQQKKTVRTEAVPGQIWTFDQIIGALYVHVPIRMSVVKLRGGGLLVFNPINPTPEAVALLKDLESEHGPVKYIVL